MKIVQAQSFHADGGYRACSFLKVTTDEGLVSSWTEAAHEAGFADSAHFTRTFKRMFGINPVDLTAARVLHRTAP